jgi:glycosyltransferase involved in cell wall biosynthesis
MRDKTLIGDQPQPLISVIMPVLNAAGHLPRSLSSLAQQEWRQFEVILVDGGSSDDTIALARQLLGDAAISHRIDIEIGSGIYEAMNLGIARARGDWLYVMGSDDQLLSDQVFMQFSNCLRLAAADVIVVHGNVWIEDPGYLYGQPWDLPRFLDRNISHQSAFYRRAPIQSMEVEYNPRYTLYADWDYNIRLFSLGRFQYEPLSVASYACTGASSQRVDELFLAEKERNAIDYFGWRACWLMPPYRFSLGCSPRSGLRRSLQLALNRVIWFCRRLFLRRS